VFTGNNNYKDQSEDVAIEISKADAACTVSGYEGVYDAAFHGASGSCSGIGGESAGTLDLGMKYANVPGGTAHWVFTGNNNYKDQSSNVVIVINKAMIRITAENNVKLLNAPNPPLTFKYTGLVGTEMFDVIDTKPICSTLANTNSPIGTYSITCSGGNDNNYEFSYIPGLLAIQYASGVACYSSAGHQILQPIEVDGSSVFKQKSTVPAKFRVCDANGVSIGTPGVVALFRNVQIITGTTVDAVNEPIDSTTPFDAFRWSSTDQQWIFNMSTKLLGSGKTYVYLITLNDGSTIQFQFGLK
jgi:hypothetical protein